MTEQFRGYGFEYQTYRAAHAAALATMEEALRQPAHVDTLREGFSVLVAVESEVKVVVLQGSRELVKRIGELWQSWVEGGKQHPEGVEAEDWWDFVAGDNFQRRDGEQTKNLQRSLCTSQRVVP